MHFYPGLNPGKLTFRTYHKRLKHAIKLMRMMRPSGSDGSLDSMLDQAAEEREEGDDD